MCIDKEKDASHKSNGGNASHRLRAVPSLEEGGLWSEKLSVNKKTAGSTRRLSLYSAVCVSVAPTMACVHVWFSVTR